MDRIKDRHPLLRLEITKEFRNISNAWVYELRSIKISPKFNKNIYRLAISTPDVESMLDAGVDPDIFAQQKLLTQYQNDQLSGKQ